VPHSIQTVPQHSLLSKCHRFYHTHTCKCSFTYAHKKAMAFSALRFMKTMRNMWLFLQWLSWNPVHVQQGY